MFIASENITVMLSVIDTELWLSAVVETEVTVGAVVSVVEEPPEDVVVLSELAVLLSLDDEHEETSTVMLTKRINQDNIFFISFFIENVEKVGLKSHKLKLFNPIDLLTKTKY